MVHNKVRKLLFKKLCKNAWGCSSQIL
jgi:hypothetical protein